MTSLSSQGAGPCQLPAAGGATPGEDWDQREKKGTRTRRSTPSSTLSLLWPVWGQRSEFTEGRQHPQLLPQGDSPLVMWDILAIFLGTPSIRTGCGPSPEQKASSILPRPRRASAPGSSVYLRAAAIGSWPTPGHSHMRTTRQLLPNSAGHVFQN